MSRIPTRPGSSKKDRPPPRVEVSSVPGRPDLKNVQSSTSYSSIDADTGLKVMVTQKQSTQTPYTTQEQYEIELASMPVEPKCDCSTDDAKKTAGPSDRPSGIPQQRPSAVERARAGTPLPPSRMAQPQRVARPPRFAYPPPRLPIQTQQQQQQARPSTGIPKAGCCGLGAEKAPSRSPPSQMMPARPPSSQMQAPRPSQGCPSGGSQRPSTSGAPFREQMSRPAPSKLSAPPKPKSADAACCCAGEKSSEPSVPPDDPAKIELQQRVQRELVDRSKGSLIKMKRTGKSVSKTNIPSVMTQRGLEPAIQQVVIERRVGRGPEAEHIIQHISAVNVDDDGNAKRYELNLQQIDPNQGTGEDGEMEMVKVISSLTVTASEKQFAKKIIRQTTKNDDIGKTREEVAELIQEEIREIEEALNLPLAASPEVVVQSYENVPLKQKQMMFTLKPENVAALQESIIHPTVTADEVQVEPPPETIANIMNCLEKGGITAQTLPTQIFGNLYPEGDKDEYINVNSVVPGPLQDAVVPIEIPQGLPKDDLCLEIEDLMKMDNIPEADLFTELNLAVPDTPKGTKLEGIDMETPPWSGAYKQSITQSIGADEVIDLDSPSGGSGGQVIDEEFEKYLEQGIEFFLETQTVPYECKIQLRGSQPPDWFPGYFVALPDLPEVIKISRTPSEVFSAAWKSVQPKFFNTVTSM